LKLVVRLRKLTLSGESVPIGDSKMTYPTI
jgi:hypothetical protein